MRILDERGFLFQVTDAEALDELALTENLPCYIGFDCTAPSLHVGSLVQIMMLRWAQKTGHKPIVLMGGGTTRIGDPTGRDDMRKVLDDATIAANMKGIKGIFDRFLTFGDGAADAVMVNNADWLDGLNYVDFLRTVGHHFTINRMLTFDSVKMRLEREQPMTFLEFNYMILQAYDFVELSRRLNCRVQLGGSDQWGNIVNGIELGRRLDDVSLYGITSPLITKSDGSKMGKTAKGAVWLNDDALPAYDYYQFWRNTTDSDVGRFLRLFTELDMAEIARLEALKGSEINDAKKILAFEATRLARGIDAARHASRTARETFEQGAMSAGLPTLELAMSRVQDGIGVLDLFVEAGLASSRKEVRRLITQGGARIDDQPIKDEGLILSSTAFAKGPVKLSSGRKRHVLVKIA